MNFLCDVHISFKVKQFLIKAGHQAVHTNDILEGDITSDSSISNFCEEDNFILITKDFDFVDSYYLKKPPPKLIKINLGNISTGLLIQRLRSCLS